MTNDLTFEGTSSGNLWIYGTGTATVGGTPPQPMKPYKETNREWLDRRVKEMCDYWK